MSHPTRLSSPFILPLLLIAATLATTVTSQMCGRANFTSNSTYKSNLDRVLSLLPRSINATGFYSASTGRSPDRLTAITLCRGDISFNDCRECVSSSSIDLVRACPLSTQAIIWRDPCMVRYSNQTISGVLENRPNIWWWSDVNATSPDLFKQDMIRLIDNLRDQAASGDSFRKVAAGNTTGPDFQTIFAMVQCTPDLSQEDCSFCLIGAAGEIPSCCDRKRGGRVYYPSCAVRFETYEFYNKSRLHELGPATVENQPPSILQTGNSDGKRTRTIVIIVVSITVVALIVVIVGILLVRQRRKQKPMEELDFVDEDKIITVESLQYAFSTIRDATNDFSDNNKLGQGRFGTVYKGKLPNGEEIAVKRLSEDSRQGDLEFKNEVLLLAKLHHRNLVRLRGFALEGAEKLLVYEFVPNASLDIIIFESTMHSYLNWERRYKIIGGIAKGLLYLHEDSRFKIIHRNLKANNILLDMEMNPKITDFGVARLFGDDESHERAASNGVETNGYMPPEYIADGKFSAKSDVFSFGVLILEIISGRRNNDFRNEIATDLLSFAWKHWQSKTFINIVDPFLTSTSSASMTDIRRCIHIGLLCVQKNPNDRPTMSSVALMFSDLSVTLTLPYEPAFYLNNRPELEFSSTSENNTTSSSYKSAQTDEHYSKSGVSLTKLY